MDRPQRGALKRHASATRNGGSRVPRVVGAAEFVRLHFPANSAKKVNRGPEHVRTPDPVHSYHHAVGDGYERVVAIGGDSPPATL